MVYVRRIIDTALDEVLGGLPAVALEGPKGVGKTETGSRRASAVFDLDDPDVLEVVQSRLDEIDRPDGTVLVDEWQRHPPVWDRVRRLVDRGAPPGRFLLAGSAAPRGVIHSGAGRIVPVRMRPMSLAERQLVTPTVSTERLLLGDGTTDVDGRSDVDLEGYVEEIVASGFPGIRTLDAPLRQRQLAAYVDRITYREFPDQGRPLRSPESLRAWMAAYAAATAMTTSYTSLLDASTPGSIDKPAKATTQAYRDVLGELWMLDPLPGWAPGFNHLDRLTRAPKHQLADPALAASLLGATVNSLLRRTDPGPRSIRDGALLGRLFEALVTLSVRTYADAARSRTFHLRQSSGRHEVDLVVERADGCILALEVKLAAAVDDRDVEHLLWLRDQLGDDLLDMVVVTTGPYAYRRRDGVAVVPAALLGP